MRHPRHPFIPYTVSGAIDGLFYRIRTWFTPAAPEPDRCWMGMTVDDWVWCPRRAMEENVFCKKHARHMSEWRNPR